MTAKRLDRRMFLRGLGTAVALPMLDAMTPAWGAPAKAAAGKAPLRLAVAYVPNGIDMTRWTPATVGKGFELTPILEPLAAVRDQVTIFSGLAHDNGRPKGDGAGDHARAAASFLTAVHPRKTNGADIQNGISVDQVIAQSMAGKTRLASLELGTEPGGLAGNCDSGYSCAYSNSLVWRTPTSPMPAEINPRLVFERMFGGADEGDTAESRARRLRHKRSLLDFVADDSRRLMRELGPTDRRKVDEYLYAIREIEQRIASAELASKDFAPTMERPAGVPAEFRDHVGLMYDLMALAFQADQTRVITFMMGREGSRRTYRDIGVSDPHHPLSHHQNDPEKIERISRINRHHVELFAKFLERLKATPDGDGTLLDHCAVVYGSGISDGNRHQHHNLPVLLAGGANGTIQPGRHVRFDREVPMANLYVSLLDRMGVKLDQFGDSTGPLADIAGL